MNTLIKDLAKLAKVSDVEAFAKALQSETDTDYKLDTSSLIVRTKEEDEVFKSNISKEVKDKAFNDAFEIQIKNMKKDLGLEFDGKKSEDFISHFKQKILDEAKVEPNKRISELESTIEKINGNLTEREKELNNIKLNFNKEKTRLETESYIPNLPENLALDKKEVADLFFMKYEIKDDGVYKGDERLVDEKTAQPLGIKEAVDGFVAERGWNRQIVTGRGGQGINNPATPTPQTLDEFNDYAKSKGLTVGSKDYNAELATVVKENPDIIK